LNLLAGIGTKGKERCMGMGEPTDVHGMLDPRAGSDVLVTLSHEFRTPLCGIMGMVELLKATDLDERQREYVAAVENSAAGLMTLIEDILELSRVEAGKAAPRSLLFDVRALVGDVARMLEPAARRKGLAITCTIAAEVPARLIGDPGRIGQVITNLAGNAVKFSDAGAVALEVQRAAATGDGCAIRLNVRDDGPGIPLECQESVFEPFTQLDSEEGRLRGGTGLGLAICRSLVKLLGGRIGLESTPGRGTMFWVELPLAVAEVAAPPARGDELPDLPPLDVALRVLVVEDDTVSRSVALELIRRLGCQGAAVGDGRAALAALETQHHDLVLMDVRLPGMDGLAATGELRRREAEAGLGRRVPVIAMTASTRGSEPLRCLLAGMDDYIAKPLTPQVLHRALLRWGRAGSDRGPHENSAGSPCFAGDGPSLDCQLLAECCGNSPALMTDVLEAFLRSTPASLSTIAAAAAAGDAPGLEREAHRLKGACQTIGAGAMAAACATLMALARQGSLTGTPAAAQVLQDHWETARDEASALLATLRGG
jgi:CheY-like chemotaxis protein/HPt (histidine-containing phosphotransfer) domain-containing protein